MALQLSTFATQSAQSGRAGRTGACPLFGGEADNMRSLSLIRPSEAGRPGLDSEQLRILAIRLAASTTCVLQDKPEKARICLHRPADL